MARGRLRIYLGAAPGVGKTFAMLNEGWRRKERGSDIVVGLVETHDRPRTTEQLRDLEIIPRRRIEYRGQVFEEMDLDAILARRPEVALVDELAHTNVPGTRHTKRWQDIEELLDAGIDVISTVNIQHLESLNDVVQGITGVVQRERVPDHVVRRADQIELVDMSPESLRRRMAHGNIYGPDKVDAALGNYFRVGNLSALRELALLWVADRVDEGLQAYRERHGIAEPWETKERVVVALTGSPKGERLIRRGARMAARSRAELVGVSIRPTDGLGAQRNTQLEANRALLEELGGRYHAIAGNDVPSALVDFARAENATQLLLGATNRSRLTELVQGSVINRVIRQAGTIDVHVLSAGGHESTKRLPHLPRRVAPAALPRRRVTAGWVMAIAGLPLVTLMITHLRGSLGPTLGLPEQLLAVIAVAIVGGFYPAVAGSLIAFALTDWYLIPPLHSWTIGRAGDLVALATFVVAAFSVSLLIDQLARRTLETVRAQAESEALAGMAGKAVLTGAQALPRLVDDLRGSFGLDAVAVLAPVAVPAGGSGGITHRDRWAVVASSGSPVPQDPESGTLSAELAGGSVLVISGSTLAAADRRLLDAFVNQLRLAQETEELARAAASATSLAEANQLRTALLAAVSHDLRTPLASIKASISSLIAPDVDWPPDAVRSFYETIDLETDRLTSLVGNLLDMSRLQTGALKLMVRPVGLEEVVFAAVRSISGDATSVEIDVPETLAPVDADPALLERAVANLIGNALHWNTPGCPVTVSASEAPPWSAPVRRAPAAGAGAAPSSGAADDGTSEDATGADEDEVAAAERGSPRIELRIVDRGCGIPEDKRDAVFLPFQRLGDSGRDGVGLGLAVARGFIEAMRGELTLDDTPGGGLTAIVSLPVAAGASGMQPAEAVGPPATAPEVLR